ncbi:basic salivary proline-rich protein 1-like [Canis lupus familiaris]|uniref:basic salivary proline-rich protein 1-like n=1 Tax=Canis lupus familiaris TaxID=9615 RepID=UPI0018F7B17B|nr:basic salivary proline-rich protein 1-like [Canis lupus familiaris]
MSKRRLGQQELEPETFRADKGHKGGGSSPEHPKVRGNFRRAHSLRPTGSAARVPRPSRLALAPPCRGPGATGSAGCQEPGPGPHARGRLPRAGARRRGGTRIQRARDRLPGDSSILPRPKAETASAPQGLRPVRWPDAAFPRATERGSTGSGQARCRLPPRPLGGAGPLTWHAAPAKPPAQGVPDRATFPPTSAGAARARAPDRGMPQASDVGASHPHRGSLFTLGQRPPNCSPLAGARHSIRRRPPGGTDPLGRTTACRRPWTLGPLLLGPSSDPREATLSRPPQVPYLNRAAAPPVLRELQPPASRGRSRPQDGRPPGQAPGPLGTQARQHVAPVGTPRAPARLGSCQGHTLAAPAAAGQEPACAHRLRLQRQALLCNGPRTPLRQVWQPGSATHTARWPPDRPQGHPPSVNHRIDPQEFTLSQGPFLDATGVLPSGLHLAQAPTFRFRCLSYGPLSDPLILVASV